MVCYFYLEYEKIEWKQKNVLFFFIIVDGIGVVILT